MIFVDTSAWFARYTPRDPYYKSARQFHVQSQLPLITTDYVIDETLTLMKARGNYDRARQFGHRIFTGTVANLVFIEPQDIDAAWQIFNSFQDKQWSFTDCTSYVVMQRLHIQTAFAFDDDFRQFGTVEVVPAFDSQR